MKKLSVLIVDDEPLARETVRDLVNEDEEVELIGECGDGATALVQIRECCPDIVFLDIEMPAASGLDLLAEIPSADRPVVVYVTAYEAFAVRAFGLEALDYVLKPFSDERFCEALERAKRRAGEARLSKEGKARSKGAAGETSEEQPHYVDRVAVKRGGRVILLPVDQIRWIESEDYYARIHSLSESYLLRVSLNSLEERLDPSVFQRVHRTAIVRREKVLEIRRLPGGGKLLVLDDQTEVRVSRSKTRDIESWLASV